MTSGATPRSQANMCVPDDFGGRGEDELVMMPRDKIELIELDEEFGDAWYLGKNLRTGQTGLFPASMRSLEDLPPDWRSAS